MLAPQGQPVGGGPSGVSVTTTPHVAHLLQSRGVVTVTLHIQPPSGTAEHVEPFAAEFSVAAQVPNWKPESQFAWPKS